MRPICIHLSVILVEAFQLQLEIGATHERIVDILLQVEYVIADGEIVQQTERWKYDAITDGECQSHLFAVVHNWFDVWIRTDVWNAAGRC